MSQGTTAAPQRAGGVVTSLNTPKLAGKADRDQRMDYLGTHHWDTDEATDRLAGLQVTVIGAGPAGLVFARNAAAHGAQVTILEKAGDPRDDNVGYTNRSFNITLDNVGRQVIGDERAWETGIWLEGRALHARDGSEHVDYAHYGSTPDSEYISIPRSTLRRNLCMLAKEAGADMRFHANAVTADTKTGQVIYKTKDGALQRVQSDLIVFCDGLHTIANDEAVELGMQMWPEPRNFINGRIAPEDNPGFSLQHIHFWHETTGNYTIGIPNIDGSISLLLVSLFSDIASDEHPFATPEQAQIRLQHDFANLYKVAPQLAERLPNYRRGTFCFKTVEQYRVGKKGVVVGDAAIVFPPWAGYGANQAMYGAAALAQELMLCGGVVDDALENYQVAQKLLCEQLIEFVAGQGDFLSGPVVDDPAGRSDDALSMIIEETRGRLSAEHTCSEDPCSVCAPEPNVAIAYA
jgi:2-polyprenyl-6-methoxyphenol hydroxylase-like FAD-dependent oxidoreductase